MAEEKVAKASGAKKAKAGKKAGRGMQVARYFTTPGVHPADEIAWDHRSAAITGEDGKVVFEQKDIEVPKSWSMLATNVVASKYFRGTPGTSERETSVRQLVKRVVDTVTGWGKEGGYFASAEDAQAFEAELSHLLLRQKASFNSPVWFNVGVEKQPQCSACFINSVDDSMESILGLAKTEGMLFKYGSGTGSNLSTLRSAKELLAGGGTASGPVSFMKGFDAFAGVIKSGGKTRRAAKMVILNDKHPDVLEFIRCKANEEKKAWALIDSGYDGSFNGEAYGSVFFQNSNNSVRATDAFMKAVENDGDWTTRAVRDGRPMDTYKARTLFREIADAAHLCGDPGMQFHDTINAWHTCKNTAPINASNPCSEYMFLDDTACNLASLNLMHFRNMDGEFDVESFKHACNVLILAQEILVDFAKYPTDRIARNSHAFRPLGLGFANLGALLMARGLAYDSDEGRAYAGAITALMCGEAYAQSARIAKELGTFEGYAANREPFLGVIGMHRKASYGLDKALLPKELFAAATVAWDDALGLGNEHGYRNAQVTVLAPTGTIGFMMDCDTTGIEPDIALIKYKKLVGGGMLKIVNNTVPLALEKLGYTPAEQGEILGYLEAQETIEGAPHLKAEHLPVFDCAFKPAKGKRSIHWLGHISMMAACQPFLSGAISKTVNLPHDATPQDIEKAYLESWKQGLKAVAVYRDGCKRTQPLNTSLTKVETKVEAKNALQELAASVSEKPTAVRRKLPDERKAITHKFSIAGHEGYLTVGMYEDGSPGELFVVMAKEGSTISGLMDSFATAISLSLQYGVPLKVLVDKFSHTRFEPSGFTGNRDIPIAKSITDYLVRWLALKFLPTEAEIAAAEAAHAEAAEEKAEQKTVAAAPVKKEPVKINMQSSFLNQADAPPCHTCGSIMVRSGACYKCGNCGATSGCS
ncbi:MAG: vitamin B12-dependent ribonucleotide reductase [Deltaproteobacteria bacterium]|nr:vitamin B12-dependent ribonucleotide reductase [Deltaproteobacteria bacterium]